MRLHEGYCQPSDLLNMYATVKVAHETQNVQLKLIQYPSVCRLLTNDIDTHIMTTFTMHLSGVFPKAGEL